MYGGFDLSHRRLKSKIKDDMAVDIRGRVYGDLEQWLVETVEKERRTFF